MKFTQDGAHFYDMEGNPRYDATLGTAKKEGLLISPTTYLKILDKPAINNWRIKEYLQSAHEIMTRFPGTSLDEMMGYSKKNFDERNNAAEKGTAIHWVLEEAIKNVIPVKQFESFFKDNADPLIKDLYGSVKLAYEWFDQNCINPVVETVVVSKKYRYAGKKDVGCQALDESGKTYLSTILDWKSQGVKHPGYQKRDPSKLYAVKMNVYKEWVIQLGAYAAPTAEEQGIIGVVGTDPKFPYFKPVRYNQEQLLEGFKVFRCLQILYGLMEGVKVPG